MCPTRLSKCIRRSLRRAAMIWPARNLEGLVCTGNASALFKGRARGTLTAAALRLLIAPAGAEEAPKAFGTRTVVYHNHPCAVLKRKAANIKIR